MSTLHIGCHLSPSQGLCAMGRDALSIGADTYQFFTRNPRGSKAKAIDPEDAAALTVLQADHGFAPVVAHAPYTLNPCSGDARVREFAELTMADDMARLAALPCRLYNFHPGSHTGLGPERGMELTAELLVKILPLVPKGGSLLIETMAGQGSEIGCSFEQVANIIRLCGGNERLGVCLDTCHVFAAGYDIVGDPEGVLYALTDAVGPGRLRAIHLNDSLQPFGSHKDRHACIGEGHIGKEALIRFLTMDEVQGLPVILETPQEDLAGYAREIAMLRDALEYCGE